MTGMQIVRLLVIEDLRGEIAESRRSRRSGRRPSVFADPAWGTREVGLRVGERRVESLVFKAGLASSIRHDRRPGNQDWLRGSGRRYMDTIPVVLLVSPGDGVRCAMTGFLVVHLRHFEL